MADDGDDGVDGDDGDDGDGGDDGWTTARKKVEVKNEETFLNNIINFFRCKRRLELNEEAPPARNNDKTIQ